MAFVFRPGRNPPSQQLLLCGGQGLVGFRRRHLVVRVGRQNAPDQFALLRFAGHERLALDRLFANVQTQFPFSFSSVGSVTEKAVVGKDGPDVAVVADGLFGSRGGGGGPAGKALHEEDQGEAAEVNGANHLDCHVEFRIKFKLAIGSQPDQYFPQVCVNIHGGTNHSLAPLFRIPRANRSSGPDLHFGEAWRGHFSCQSRAAIKAVGEIGIGSRRD